MARGRAGHPWRRHGEENKGRKSKKQNDDEKAREIWDAKAKTALATGFWVANASPSHFSFLFLILNCWRRDPFVAKSSPALYVSFPIKQAT